MILDNIYLGLKTNYIEVKGLTYQLQSTGLIIWPSNGLGAFTPSVLLYSALEYNYLGEANSKTPLPEDFNANDYNWYLSRFVREETRNNYQLADEKRQGILNHLDSISVNGVLAGNFVPNSFIKRYQAEGNYAYYNSNGVGQRPFGNISVPISGNPISINSSGLTDTGTEYYIAPIFEVVGVRKGSEICNPVEINFEINKKPLLACLEIEVKDNYVAFYLNRAIGLFSSLILNLFNEIYRTIEDIFKNIVDTIKDGFNNAYDGMYDIFTNLDNLIADIANLPENESNFFTDFLDYVSENGNSAISWVYDSLNEAIIKVSELDNESMATLDRLQEKYGSNLIQKVFFSDQCNKPSFDIYLSPLCPDGSCEFSCGDKISCFTPDGICLEVTHNLLDRVVKNGITFNVYE